MAIIGDCPVTGNNAAREVAPAKNQPARKRTGLLPEQMGNTVVR